MNNKNNLKLINLSDFPCVSGVYSTPSEALALIEAEIARLKSGYPSIEVWFQTKVVPEFLSNSGIRPIIVVIDEMDTAALAAFCILKNTDQEKKICTLYVLDDYRGMGLGEMIFETSFDQLGTRMPYLTISEHLIPSYSHLLEKFGFRAGLGMENLYVPGMVEIPFNS